MLKSHEVIALSENRRRLGDVDDAAAVLNVPRSWIYDRTRRNAIPPDVMLRVGKKYVRFDLDRLFEWAKAGCPEE